VSEPTLDEYALAHELHAVGAAGQRASCTAAGIETFGTWAWETLTPHQQAGWYAIARHVLANFHRTHDYAPAFAGATAGRPAEKGGAR
jgi:hypothetical protein